MRITTVGGISLTPDDGIARATGVPLLTSKWSDSDGHGITFVEIDAFSETESSLSTFIRGEGVIGILIEEAC